MFRRLTKTLFKTYGVVSETIRLSADQRIGPIETQTYKVRARLISYKLEQDGDFHIVIADVEDPGKTMIAEIPSPDCAGACASAHVEEFRRARAVIMEISNQASSVSVVVTGVGFFDFLHGQTGAAPNGIELHPVLKIEPESDSSLRSVSSPKASAENKQTESAYGSTRAPASITVLAPDGPAQQQAALL